MTDGSTRGAWRSRLLLMGDAFLYAAALDIIASSVFMTIASATGFADTDVAPTSAFAIAMQLGFLVATVLVVGSGAVLAWRLHEREIRGGVIGAMVVGVVLGVPVITAVFGSIAFMLSRVPLPVGSGEDGPPWLAIGVLGVLAAAMFAVPIVQAVRVLISKRSTLRQDWLRLAALGVIIALAVIVWPLVGGEAAEAGIFMIPFAAAAMLAVAAADFYCSVRDRGRATGPASTA